MSQTLFAILNSPQMWLLVFCSYFLGSIPFGYVLYQILHRKDIRDLGSGNIGATNVARASKKLGAVVLILDCFKGWLFVALAKSLDFSSEQQLLIGFAAFIGHCFPVWLRFKGGKGIATGLGVLIAAAPFLAVVGLSLFLVVYLISRFVSLASILAVIGIVVSNYFSESSFWVQWIIGIMVVIIIIKHQDNIRRLWHKKEKTF